MIAKLLPKQYTRKFIKNLESFGKVHAPVMKDDQNVVFSEVEDPKDVVLHYQTTIIPPKKYFFKPEQVILTFSKDKGYEIPEEELREKLVLFGVHSCDIAALQILDLVFSDNYYDKFYFTRRRNTVVIGISCTPDIYCFCSSMGTDYVEKGFDLFLTDIGDEWFVRIGTARGDDIVRHNDRFFKEATPESIREFKDFANKFHEMFTRHLDLSNLSPILELEYQSKLWDELGDKCLSCGTCSLICPTCYCHNMVDKVDFKGTGERVRTWDCCLYEDFSLVAGGHNFRESRASRIKTRFFHKQQGFVEKYGRPSCVGCGRCIEKCPAGIDMVSILEKIRGETDVAV